MTVLDTLYATIINFFMINKTPVDVIDLPTRRFIKSLEEQGFKYDNDKEYYVRVWSTDTPEGQLDCLEIYKQEEDKWKSIMIGSEGDTFFENEIDIMEHTAS